VTSSWFYYLPRKFKMWPHRRKWNLNNIQRFDFIYILSKGFLIIWPSNCKETELTGLGVAHHLTMDPPFLCFIFLINKIPYFVVIGHGHREACKLIHKWQLKFRGTTKYLDSSVASYPQNAVVLELVRPKTGGRNCTTSWQVCDCGWGTDIHKAVQEF
jgi:hypothetical protein